MNEKFFIENDFYSEFTDFLDDYQIDEDNVQDLPDDWEVKIELSDLEPIFDLDAETLCKIISQCSEERLSEDENEEDKIIKALEKCVDFEKLKKELPKLYYPNWEYETITKADLLKYFENRK